MKRKKLFKSLALALSISLLAPLASKVHAEEANITAPEVVAESALTMDMDTGEVIYSKNADAKRSMASTTKLLTGLLFAENKSNADVVTFTEEASKQPDASLNVNYKKMHIGDTMTAEDAMEALLIFSANDVAYMIANSVSGNVGKFVDLMNQKVQQFGLKNTHFINPCGLEASADSYNYTTAYDLAIIAKEAFKNQWVRETLAPKNPPATIDITGSKVILETRNKLLGKDGNIGGKTGMETQAGHCFVGYYNKDGRNLVTVALNSVYGSNGMSVFNDTKKIADYSYNAKKELYKKAGEEVGTTDLEYKVFGFFGPKKTITAPIVVSEDVMYFNNDLNSKDAHIQYNSDEKNAWKLTGDKEVELTFSTPGHTENIKGVVKVSAIELLKANIGFYLALLVICVIVVALILVMLKLISMRKRRYRRRY